MRFLFAVLGLALVMSACKGGKKTPDVSGIKIDIKTERFERAFFDTSANNLAGYLKGVSTASPGFTQTYLYEILGIDPRIPVDTNAAIINRFIEFYRPVYTEAEKKFSDFTPWEKQIRQGLQYLKYYFPSYKTPAKIITYIGPLDGSGDGIANDGLLVGLHHHLGKDYPLYKSEEVQNYYPNYISRRFEPAYIPVNAMKNLVLDMYPEKLAELSLVDQMIEKGKRLYIQQLLLPGTNEALILGYTEEQLKDCYAHETIIWDLFVKNDLLRSTDKNLLKNYLDEGPKTQELGEGSPGNIGSFAGWQIIKKYMDAKPATTPVQLMSLPAETIFQEAKYKP